MNRRCEEVEREILKGGTKRHSQVFINERLISSKHIKEKEDLRNDSWLITENNT